MRKIEVKPYKTEFYDYIIRFEGEKSGYGIINAMVVAVTEEELLEIIKQGSSLTQKEGVKP